MKLFDVNKMLGTAQPLGPIPPEKEFISHAMKVAWPAMVESFLVSLVSIVDTMMVGSLGSGAISAVGLTTQPKFIFLSVFLSFNVAVSAVVARRVGERDREDANRVLSFAILMTIVFTAIISALAVIYARPIVELVGGEPDTIESATQYLTVIVAGLGFTTISLVINAAQRGAGNTKIAMRTNLVSNGVNIVFNYLLIGGNFGFPRLEVRGAAIATVIGSVCACVMSIRSVSKSESFLFIWNRQHFGIKKRSLNSLTKIGASSLAEQFCQRIGFLLYAMTVARLGTQAFAAHQIGINICNLSFSLGEGLSFAAIALVGQNLGLKRPDLAKIYATVCQRIGFICSCVLSVVFLTTGRLLFSLFSKEEGVLVFGAPIMAIMCLVTFFQIAAVVYSGALRGAGDTVFTALVSLLSVGIIRPGMSWLLCYPAGLGLIGAWLGFTIDLSVRWMLTMARFRSNKWAKIVM